MKKKGDTTKNNIYYNIIIFYSTGKLNFKLMRITSYISQYHYI